MRIYLLLKIVLRLSVRLQIECAVFSLGVASPSLANLCSKFQGGPVYRHSELV